MKAPTLFDLAPATCGIVYFTRCRNKIKIGFTGRDARTRVMEFETGNPEPLEIIGQIAAPVGRDRELHDDPRFAPYRVRPDREWFYATPEVMGAIEELIKEDNERRSVVTVCDGDLWPNGDGTYTLFTVGPTGIPRFGQIEGYEAEALIEFRSRRA